MPVELFFGSGSVSRRAYHVHSTIYIAPAHMSSIPHHTCVVVESASRELTLLVIA
jgi:hypothetical protein